MKLCEYINECLNEIGVEKVFGVPGALVMPVWQSISSAEIILCSHEQEASYVAAGYGKMAHKPVAVITTGGPGVTNCISGVASANIDSVPMVYISGRTPLDKNGKGLRQEESHVNRLYDSVDILKNFTKQSFCIHNLNIAAKKIRECIRYAVEGRCGAVHISVPVDLQNGEIVVEHLQKLEKLSAEEDPLIPKVSKPVIIMGWGCWMGGAVKRIYELAEKIKAPILVTSKAYCCIRSNNPFFLGKLGYGYTPYIEEFLSTYSPDAILTFGTSLGEKDIPTNMWKDIESADLYIFSNDKSAYECKRIDPKKVIEGEINRTVACLCSQMPERKDDRVLLEMIRSTRENTKEYWQRRIAENDLMAKVIDSLNQYVNEDIVITADAGNHLANAAALIEKINEGSFFLDVGIRAMGNGICTAVGMAIADPAKIYVAITGDGCMLMNGNVMHLASIRKLPVIFVVFNHHALGRVRVGQTIMNDFRATDIYNVDFQMYGKAFGIDTYQFTLLEEFENNIQKILLSRKTALVEVVTDHDEIPVSVKDNIY